MSARGWADTLTRAATVLQTVIEEFPAHEPSVDVGVARDVAALRELAALLDRITPEAMQELQALGERHCAAAADCDVPHKLIDTIAALVRGPAEQQETGR